MNRHKFLSYTVVEYSVAEKQIYLGTFEKMIRENVRMAAEGVDNDYKLIGVFPTREGAVTFADWFLDSLVSLNRHRDAISKPEMSSL